MTIHYDLEVPIPEGSKLHKETNEKYSESNRMNVVDVHYDGGKQIRERIGVKSDTDGMMHPNSKYFELHGGDYLEYINGKDEMLDRSPLIKQHTLSAGLYLMVHAISDRLGIYDLLIKSFGVKMAHAVLDFTCFLIRHSDNAAHKQTCQMYDQVLFSHPLYSEKWYSSFFCDKSNLNNNNCFQDLWIKHWIAEGISDVYISVDGSNVDCESDNNEDAERGCDKSGSRTTILSFMWVVVASGKYKGMPLAYITYNGSQVDCGSFKEIVARLSGYGLHVAGFILDRGFCTAPVMKAIASLKSSFIIIMMTDKIGGYTGMVEKHGKTIRNSSKYYIGKEYFGTTDRMQVFKGSDIITCIALYYNPIDAAKSSIKLLSGVKEAANGIAAALRENKKYSIPSEYKKYISVKKVEVAKTEESEVAENQDVSYILEVEIDHERLDEDCLRFGFSCIASSEDLSAEMISTIYDLREASELAFKYFKTPLGEGVVRAHTKVSASNRMFPGFLAVAIYNEFQKLCKQTKLSASRTVVQLDRVKYVLSNESYSFSDNYSSKIRGLLESLGISNIKLQGYASVINERYSNISKRNNPKIQTIPYREGCCPSPPAILDTAGNDHADVWNFSIKSSSENSDSIVDEILKIASNNVAELKEIDDSSVFEATNTTNIEDEKTVVFLSKEGRLSKEETGARIKDLQLGDLISTKGHEGTDSQNRIAVPRKAGRPKGSRDSTPRKRRTYAELGKESRKSSKAQQSQNGTPAKRGRPQGSKDSYQRVRRTKSDLKANGTS